MQKALFATALVTGTLVSVALYPAAHPTPATATTPPAGTVNNATAPAAGSARPHIDVVFALDTTGSMGGLIAAAKDKIWAIASSMALAQPAPIIRMGLVAYRDRGDEYVTRVVDLSEDLDSVYANLMDLQAAGGGDGPESVNQALHDAIHRISWRRDPRAYKAVFLVGDAPPHMDYQDEVTYVQTLLEAQQSDIVVNAIQCGQDGGTGAHWREIAQRGHGSYFQVDQAGSAVAIASPYDQALADLSRELDATRLYYGTVAQQAQQRRKTDATAKLHAAAPVAARARRAAFNATESGSGNLLGDGELIDDIASGRVELDAIEPRNLPAALQTLAEPERRRLVARQAKRRSDLEQQIDKLTAQRASYLQERVAAAGGAEQSLDDRIYRAVREQAATKGLHYTADAPAY